jgi:hypothetical protein
MSLILLVLLSAGQLDRTKSPTTADEAATADVAVVCPAALRDALGPWVEYRQRQGHRVAIVSNRGSADDVRRRIREVARGGRLRFVVLVGDAEPDMVWDETLRERCVPMHYAKARVNVLWGSQATISTDNWYVQPDEATDEDPRPQWAIGRLTADSPDELRRMIAKIVAYERSEDFGPWRRQLNFVAGVGGFGAFADMVIESAAQYFLTESIPADYHVSMTYGSWQSPYCPDPRRFRETTVRRLNEGSLFWVYIGHGNHLGLDRVHAGDADYPVLEAADAESLACVHGRPIALFMSCYAGAIDARHDCLAEIMLRTEGGPVAVLAGSRVTMPYAMTVLATCLTDELFRARRETLGEAVLHAKQNMLRRQGDGDVRRAILDSLASAISPDREQLAAERAEHVLMFNLIGDPLLRLRHPQPIRIEGPASAPAGETLELSGECPIDGRGTLELVVRRDRLLFERPDRAKYPQTAEGLDQLQAVYQRANDRRAAVMEVEVHGGRFTARLPLPGQLQGRCHVCLSVEGPGDFASGAMDLDVTPVAAQRQVLRK